MTDHPLSQLSLGKHTDYPQSFDAKLLQAVPRQLNRNSLGIDAHTLPFSGFDEWTLFELSWLNDQGKPQVATGLVNIDARSPNLIESKSFKLYLNSLNQQQFQSIDQLTQQIRQDLSQCAGCAVQLEIDQSLSQPTLGQVPGLCIDDETLNEISFQLSPHFLYNATNEQHIVEETLHSHLLKSNCLITNQPDWGSVAIHYRGPKINHAQLLSYLISFRQHNEFHEQCVERIFCDLLHYCQCEQLTVQARYTRRGGLDINPLRTNEAFAWPRWRTIRQ